MIIWTLLTSFCRRAVQIGFGIHSELSKRLFRLNFGNGIGNNKWLRAYGMLFSVRQSYVLIGCIACVHFFRSNDNLDFIN